MGYYTEYNLKIEGCDFEKATEVIEELRESSDGAEYALNEVGESAENCKWYDHQKDLKEFSKKYPDLVFELNGEGEESGDIWKKYFQNGKVQLCNAVIVFPEFDPRKLS